METSFVPRLPRRTRIYAIGDVHGRADLLQKMLRMIAADHLGFHGESHVIFLGDYIDRGPQSREVLDILSRPNPGGLKNVRCIRGNHEDIVLRLFRDHSVAPGWFHYGGLQTLRSYGVPVPDANQDFEDLFQLRRALREAMPEAHMNFLDNLPYSVRHGDYFFVHAGIHPDKPLDAQEPHHMMWMREPFLSSTKDLGVMVVHGHSIRMKPEIRTNRIGIDTGAYATGRLTCLVMQDDERRMLST
jgi:serine/threonine protein phosphatase 1